MQVPDGWKIKSIEEIAKVTSGGTPNRDIPAYWGGSIPWIRTTEVQNCKIHESDVKEFITEEGLKNSSAKYVPKNTILMAMIGQGKTRGQVAILTFKATTNQNCAAIIYDDDQCPEYHFNYFLSKYENIRNISNSAGQSNLSGGLIKPMRVPVPPLSEQQKIAQILSTWDKGIEKMEALIAAKQKRKKALMQQLLTGKKRFAGFEGEWESHLLGEITDITTGSSNRQDSHLTGPYTFFDRSEDIRTSDIYLFDGEAVIVAGEGQDFIPKYFVGKFDLHQRTYAIMNFKSCDGKFLYYKITQNRNHFLSQAVGSTVKSLRLPMFKKMELLLPTVNEQKKIASILTAADKEIATHQKQLAALKEQKKGLMQQLLTGKKRVKVDSHV